MNHMRAARTLACLLLAFPAVARSAPPPPPPPFLIDMTTVLLGLLGKPLVNPTLATKDDPDCARCDLTLGAAIALSLCTDRQQDASEPALSKAKRCALGMALETQKAAVLTAPQIADIESRLGNWAPIVVTRIIPLIDPNVDLSKP
jgi:hypothetical protein